MRYVKQFVTEKSPRATLSRWIAVTVMLAMTTLFLSLPALAQTKYVITDGDHVIVCMSSSNDPAVVIEEAGLQLGESDTYTTQTGNGVSEITINRIQMIKHGVLVRNGKIQPRALLTGDLHRLAELLGRNVDSKIVAVLTGDSEQGGMKLRRHRVCNRMTEQREGRAGRLIGTEFIHRKNHLEFTSNADNVEKKSG